MRTGTAGEEWRRTGDGEVADQLVRVGGAQELDEVDTGGVLAADHGGDIEALEVVQGTAQLEGLLVALKADRKVLVNVLGGIDRVGRPLVDGELGLDVRSRRLGSLHC